METLDGHLRSYVENRRILLVELPKAGFDKLTSAVAGAIGTARTVSTVAVGNVSTGTAPGKTVSATMPFRGDAAFLVVPEKAFPLRRIDVKPMSESDVSRQGDDGRDVFDMAMKRNGF